MKNVFFFVTSWGESKPPFRLLVEKMYFLATDTCIFGQIKAIVMQIDFFCVPMYKLLFFYIIVSKVSFQIQRMLGKALILKIKSNGFNLSFFNLQWCKRNKNGFDNYVLFILLLLINLLCLQNEAHRKNFKNVNLGKWVGTFRGVLYFTSKCWGMGLEKKLA